MIESTNSVWLLEAPEEGAFGVVDDLDSAERILRAQYFDDRGWPEDVIEAVGHRLTFDLKFNQWVLFFDDMPDWGYTATKIPKL